MTLLSDLALLAFACLRALWDVLIGRERRCYDYSLFIRAPRELVWSIASAHKVTFEGPVPIKIDCSPAPWDRTLISGTVAIGDKRIPVAMREISVRPGEAKVVQLLETESGASIVMGRDHFVTYVLADAPEGTLFSVRHELTPDRFSSRALVPLAIVQNARRLKVHCERLAGVAPRPNAPVWDALMTGLITFASFVVLFGQQSAMLLILLILIHEAGHAMAMRSVGQPVQGIYFIPFFGGVAVAGAPHASEAERGFVALMGPGASVLTTMLFLVVWHATESELFAELALLSALINGLNLAPVLPLDGGHVSDALMSRWDPEVTRMVGFLCLIGGMGAAVYFELHILNALLAIHMLPMLFGGGAQRTLGPISAREQIWLGAGYAGTLAFYAAAIAILIAV